MLKRNMKNEGGPRKCVFGERCIGGRHSHVDTTVKSGAGKGGRSYQGEDPYMQETNADMVVLMWN